MVKVFISTDGTDNNSLEVTAASDYGVVSNSGYTIFQVDNDNFTVQTGAQGLAYPRDSDGISILIDNESWYYRIVVYKMVTVPRVYSGIPKYDTGWIACNVWANQHLGTTLGNDVAHSLSAPLSDLLVKVLISPTGADSDSFELYDAAYSYQTATYQMGITIFHIDNNNIVVQTGSGFLIYVRNSDGIIVGITTDSWYYKIKVWKLG